jgi:hypothetical protein
MPEYFTRRTARKAGKKSHNKKNQISEKKKEAARLSWLNRERVALSEESNYSVVVEEERFVDSSVQTDLLDPNTLQNQLDEAQEMISLLQKKNSSLMAVLERNL